VTEQVTDQHPRIAVHLPQVLALLWREAEPAVERVMQRDQHVQGEGMPEHMR